MSARMSHLGYATIFSALALLAVPLAASKIAATAAAVPLSGIGPNVTLTKVGSWTSASETEVVYTIILHNASAEAVTLTTLDDVVNGQTAFPVTDVVRTTCSLPQTIAAGADYACESTQRVRAT
jgi:hypothetical protein